MATHHHATGGVGAGAAINVYPGGIATFCVLGPSARDADVFEAVHPSGLTLAANGRTTRFDVTGVLSTSFDLPFFIVAPLIHHCVTANAVATLVVCTPHHKSRESQNTVLNLVCHLLPSLFAAAGPSCAEVSVKAVEIRHGAIIDAINIQRVTSIEDAEFTLVSRAGARVAWDTILEKLSERYSRGLASAEDSAFVVQIVLPSGGVVTLCDAGSAPTHLGNLTLVLNSNPTAPAEKRTIAPRVGLTFALERCLPPQGLVHVLCLPDPSMDMNYSMRVLRFATQLCMTVPPLTEADMFPAADVPPPQASVAVPHTTSNPPSAGGHQLPPSSSSAAHRVAPNARPPPGGNSAPSADTTTTNASVRDELVEYPSPAAAGSLRRGVAQSDLIELSTGVPLDVSTIPIRGARQTSMPTTSPSGTLHLRRVREYDVSGTRRAVEDEDVADAHVSPPSSVGSGGDVGSESDASEVVPQPRHSAAVARPYGSAAQQTPMNRHQDRKGEHGTPHAPKSPTSSSSAQLQLHGQRPRGATAAAAGPGLTPHRQSVLADAYLSTVTSPIKAAAPGRGAPSKAQAANPAANQSVTSARTAPADTADARRLRERLAECEQELLTTRHTMAAFDAELQRARQANSELTHSLNEAAHENETLRAVAEASQQEGREMSDLLRKLSARLTELQDASQRHRDETAGLRSAAGEATAEAEHLRKELHDAKKMLKLLETRERERVRNATLLRAAGQSVAAADAPPLSSRASATSASSKGAAGGLRGGGRSSSQTAARDDAATLASKKRLQELVNENARLHLKIDALTSEVAQMRARGGAAVASFDPSHRFIAGAAAGGTSAEEMGALRTEVEILRAQLATQAAEVDHLCEERAALQRVVVSHPRSNSASDILMAVSQACLRGLELLLSKMRAEVASATAASSVTNPNALRHLQQQRATQIHTVEKLKASIVAVSQKDSPGYIPSSATAADVEPMAMAMKLEIERLAHVKALLPTFAQLLVQCSKAADVSTTAVDASSATNQPPSFGGRQS